MRLEVGAQRAEHGDGDRQGEEERAEVGGGLAHLYALQPQQAGEHQDGGDEEQPLACGGEQHGAYRLADGLQQHVAEDDPGAQRQGDELPAQGARAYGNHLGIVFAEPRHDFGRIDVADDGAHGEEHHAYLDAEPEALAHARVDARSVIVAAYGLEPLPEAYDERVDEHADAAHDGHARDGRVAIPPRSHVEQDGGKACQPLAAERGASAVDDFAQVGGSGREVAQADADVLAAAVHVDQDAEAAQLAAERRPGGSRDAHVVAEYQDGRQNDVEHRARGDAHHGVEGIALETHLVVQHQRRCHERRAQQDDAQIGLGVGQDGRRGAQLAADGGEVEQAEEGDEAAHDEGADEARGRHLLGAAVVARSQAARDEVARAVSEEEAEGLYDGHHREGDAHGGGRLRVDFPDEISVYHHVDGGDQHADDGGHRQRAYQPGDGRGGHQGIFVDMFVFHIMFGELPMQI